MTAVIDGSRATDKRSSDTDTRAKDTDTRAKDTDKRSGDTGRAARRGRGTTAAQRAYQRRQQRASAPGGVLPRRAGRLAARIPFVAAVIGLLGCGLALTLLLTTRSAEDSYQLGAARADNQRRIEERAALQRDVEAGNSAPELAARARELGMIPAPDPARLLVGPDGSVTVVGDPQVAQGPPAPLLDPPVSRGPAETPVPVRPPGAVAGVLVPVTPPTASVPAAGAQQDQLVPATIAGSATAAATPTPPTPQTGPTAPPPTGPVPTPVAPATRAAAR
ncbi:hypothetical protein [Skermania piniformis]|uniref:Cell division protein FtsL n=1 Tax=Skermania pinensis TaxID=39122 RepID=A0ABX8SHE5_9ACTN|nr:hypothetical protein [Skermania piniformis]QXQ15091.1 hypothetical protein KV203_07015 [Skermania piniformis]